VASILEQVASGGDEAVLRLEEKLGGARPGSLRVSEEELRAAPEAVPAELGEAIRAAIANVRHVAAAQRDGSAPGDVREASFETHRIHFRDVAVASAGAYVPGGGGAYPSTAVMCCVPASIAGVERIAVASPPGEDGRVNQAVLAACAPAGATEVYAMGGAQAIAALALGTETVPPVDMIVGPGNRYVQEAKRQLAGRVGIDGIEGPSELMVFFDESVPLRWLALDLCAQAEHGDDGLLVACAAEPGLLAELQDLVVDLAGDRETVGDAPLALVTVASAEDAIRLADALAPEHLQLACDGAEDLAESVRFAGCVLVGPYGATAFGDYAAGSNHVLPTGGAARFTGTLGPDAFRRRLATVHLTADAARELAPTVDTLASAEGFPVHGESARARAEEKDL
jgi:histidinol dehydrogenase